MSHRWDCSRCDWSLTVLGGEEWRSYFMAKRDRHIREHRPFMAFDEFLKETGQTYGTHEVQPWEILTPRFNNRLGNGNGSKPKKKLEVIPIPPDPPDMARADREKEQRNERRKK